MCDVFSGMVVLLFIFLAFLCVRSVRRQFIRIDSFDKDLNYKRYEILAVEEKFEIFRFTLLPIDKAGERYGDECFFSYSSSFDYSSIASYGPQIGDTLTIYGNIQMVNTEVINGLIVNDTVIYWFPPSNWLDKLNTTQ